MSLYVPYHSGIGVSGKCQSCSCLLIVWPVIGYLHIGSRWSFGAVRWRPGLPLKFEKKVWVTWCSLGAGEPHEKANRYWDAGSTGILKKTAEIHYCKVGS